MLTTKQFVLTVMLAIVLVVGLYHADSIYEWGQSQSTQLVAKYRDYRWEHGGMQREMAENRAKQLAYRAKFGPSKPGTKIVGAPAKGKSFTLTVAADQCYQEKIYKCEETVERMGGGQCLVQPGTYGTPCAVPSEANFFNKDPRKFTGVSLGVL